jgi:hypothetical protein
MHPNLPGKFSLKTHPVLHPGGRFWALREATACHGDGAEIRSPKSCDAAVWLAILEYKIILPATNLILRTSFYQGTVLIQFHPPANVTPDFQKRGKKEIFFQNA